MSYRSSLHVLGHLELGDAIILNGLIRTLALDESEIIWYVKPEFVADVAKMVVDLPYVGVAAAGGGYEDPEAKWLNPSLRSLRLGFFNSGKFDASRWDFEFYRQAGIPFSERWARFKLPGRRFSPVLGIPNDPTIFVHEVPERGFLLRPESLDTTRIIVWAKKDDAHPCILDWLPEIRGASEVHVVDSCFLNLIESIFPIRGRAFFHRYAKTYSEVSGAATYPTLLGPWKIID